jgi:DNA polymerase-3 subunit delta'
MSFQNVLPTGLAELPASQVLQRALQEDRIPHALLFFGPSMSALERLAKEMAISLLEISTPTTDGNCEHPDLFYVRPQNKMRQISAEQIRDLIRNVQQTPHSAPRKVAILMDADRLHTSASNIFLKTLEEPPADTVLILLTTRYYSLLDTIRSRCMSFHIRVAHQQEAPEGWQQWLDDYTQWMLMLNGMPGHKPRFRTESLFAIYDLVPRYESILKAAMEQAVEQDDVTGSSESNMSEEELDAYRTGKQRALRHRFLQEIEQCTVDFIRAHPEQHRIIAGERIVQRLEHTRFLLDVNLPEAPAMEAFLLDSLQIWVNMRALLNP